MNFTHQVSLSNLLLLRMILRTFFLLYLFPSCLFPFEIVVVTFFLQQDTKCPGQKFLDIFADIYCFFVTASLSFLNLKSLLVIGSFHSSLSLWDLEDRAFAMDRSQEEQCQNETRILSETCRKNCYRAQ